MIAAPLPGCTEAQSLIVHLRSRGASYRQIARETRIAPRKVHDQEIAALRKIVRYLEQQAFLEPKK